MASSGASAAGYDKRTGPPNSDELIVMFMVRVPGACWLTNTWPAARALCLVPCALRLAPCLLHDLALMESGCEVWRGFGVRVGRCGCMGEMWSGGAMWSGGKPFHPYSDAQTTIHDILPPCPLHNSHILVKSGAMWRIHLTA